MDDNSVQNTNDVIFEFVFNGKKQRITREHAVELRDLLDGMLNDKATQVYYQYPWYQPIRLDWGDQGTSRSDPTDSVWYIY